MRLIPYWILSTVLALGGCAANNADTAARRLGTEANNGALSLVWERNIGAYSELLRPQLLGDMICVVNARGVAYFLRTDNGGDMLPSFEMLGGGGIITGAAACDNDAIVAVREDGVLATYDFSGNELWRKELKTRVTSSPLAADGNIIVIGHDGRINSYSSRRGDLLWRYVSPLKNLLRTPLDSSPIVVGGIVYAGFDNGIVVALRRDNGRVLWNTRMSTALNSHAVANILDVTTPVVGDDLVCATAYQGHIGCMNVDDGRLLWRTPLSSAKRAVIGDGRVFAVDLSGNINAFSTESGELLWQNTIGDAGTVALVRGALIIGQNNNSRLLALSPSSGNIISVLNMNSGILHLARMNEDSVLGVTVGGGIFRAMMAADSIVIPN